MNQIIQTQLEEIKEYLLTQSALQKEILNFIEAAAYLGISKSFLYKITSSKGIPVYRPAGKLLYFKRKELEEWLIRNRYPSVDEIQANALKMAKT